MKNLILIISFLAANYSYAQDLRINNNPYERAPENIRETEAFEHERYFYEQRMYPNNFIPEGAYEKAVEQKLKMKKENGVAMMSPFDTWSNIGPTTGFYFSYSNITSRMPTVKYDPNNGNTIYIGAAFGGIWKSTNSGATWTAKSDFENSLSSGSVAIDPSNSNIIYYGSGEATYSGASYYGRGIFKSTDGGESWVNYTSGLSSTTFTSRIVVRPNNTSQIFAAMGTLGLFKSIDAGVTWSLSVSGRCDDIVFSPTGDTAYIAGSGTGYRISTNGGSTFVSNAALTLGSRNHIAICKSFPNFLYCSIFDGASTITVFKSTNGGFNYTQIAAGQDFSGSQAWYDFYMHVNPFDPNYAYVGAVDVWRTTNGGTTNFVNITNAYGGGNVHPDQHNMDFHPTDPNQMVCVNDGGIWRSTNKGTNWINLNTNLTLTQFYRIASDPSNQNHILGGTQDNGTQRTTGAINWSAAFGGDGGEICFHVKNNSYILGETQNNGVQRSTNGGLSWGSGSSGLSGTATWVGPLLSHPDSSTIFYTGRQQVFKTINWGSSWTAISTGTSGTIREMAISKSSANIMYATSGSSIFKSTNRGYTFANVTTGLPARTITSVNVHPDSSQVAIITFSGFGAGKVYKTTNGGTSWNDISGNLPDSPTNDALIFYPGMSTSSYYAAMDVGVFLTTNYGQSWVELANGLPNTVAMHLDYHQSSNKLRVGTHGRGTWEIQISLLTIDAMALSVGDTGYQLYLSQTITPFGKVRNNALNMATFNVTRKINPGNYISTKTISNLPAGESANVTFDPWTFTPGTSYTIKDSVGISGDMNTANDTLSGSISPYLGVYTVKLCEGFTPVTFPPSGWSLAYTGTQYWTRNGVTSYGNGAGSAKFDYYNAVGGTDQSMITTPFASTVAGDSLRFDHAHSPYDDVGYVDSLIIETAASGGYTRLTVLWGGQSGGSLNTTAPSTADYTPFPADWATKKFALPVGTNKIKFRAYSGYGNNLYLDSICVVNSTLYTQYNLKVIPEGFYNTVTGNLNMKDTVRAYLRNSLTPFGVVDSATAVIDSTTFGGKFIFKNAASGTYYLQVIHRNSIETWSKTGGEAYLRGVTLSYDFTNSVTQAYGSNMVLKGSQYCIFSGDVDLSGSVNLIDIIATFNDASLFLNGYFKTDVTGNNIVDLNDIIIVYNNSAGFVMKRTP